MALDPATPPANDASAGRSPVAGAGAETGGCNCQALRMAARRATALYDAAMAPFGLRISQYALLHRLRRSGGMSVQALAAELVLDRTTLGRNLRPLERDGLVASEPDPGDRRVRRLVVTEKGAALALAAGPAWREAQGRFEAGFGAAESMALRGALGRLTEALGPEDG